MVQSVIFFVIITFLNNALAISNAQQAQILAKLVQAGSECLDDHPVTVEDLTSLKQSIFPDGENAGCFTACVFTKIGLFDDKGKLSQASALENAKEIFESEDELRTVEDFLENCAQINDEEVEDGDRGCERAKLAFNCYIENHGAWNL